VVNSFVFEASMRGRLALRAKSTFSVAGSITIAPLLPTRRKSLDRPARSGPAEMAFRALAEACAVGVVKARSGPAGAACAPAGRLVIATATAAAPSSASVIAPLRIVSRMRRA
jgi:hypothetical protein